MGTETVGSLAKLTELDEVEKKRELFKKSIDQLKALVRTHQEKMDFSEAALVAKVLAVRSAKEKPNDYEDSTYWVNIAKHLQELELFKNDLNLLPLK